MSGHRRWFFSAVGVLAWMLFPPLEAAAASAPHEELICGTSEENTRRVESLNRWVEGKSIALKHKTGASATTAPVELRNGLFFLEANPSNSPSMNAFDLEGSSLLFTRRDPGTFAVSRRPLEYDADIGTSIRRFSRSSASDWYIQPYTIKNFDFPFFDQNVRDLNVTAFNGIHPGRPTLAPFDQFGALEGLTLRDAVISPLLLTSQKISRLGYPEVFVKETTDAVRITFKTPGAMFTYDLQVSLFRNGNILFSYKQVRSLSWGSIVITSGREPWRESRAPFATATDAADDTHVSFGANIRPMLDITSVEASRIAESNLLEFRIRLKTAPDRTQISDSDALQYFVEISDGVSPDFSQLVYAEIYKSADRDRYHVPGSGWVDGSPAARLDGDTIILSALQEVFALASSSLRLNVYTSARSNDDFSDTSFSPISLGASGQKLQSDFSTLGPAEVEFRRPMVEAFTLPEFNPLSVWNQLKDQYGFREDQFDAIAMYQKYYTNIVFYAGAYSTVGNPGVDGISTRSTVGSRKAKYPALLHMNTIDYGWNETEKGSSSVSLHEFGHRWLYHLRIREGDLTTRSLNPESAHPAQYVHTAAAFPVFSSGDYSTMGGSRFKDHGDGTFTSAASGAYGFSWHELYLMGLAAPEEVEPWFYIADSDPALGGSYNPPPNSTFKGTRKDVTAQQIVDAMGPRNPSVAESPKTFRTLFVLVTEPGRPATDGDLRALEAHRGLFEAAFHKATGNRGRVESLFQPSTPGRRRGVRR